MVQHHPEDSSGVHSQCFPTLLFTQPLARTAVVWCIAAAHRPPGRGMSGWRPWLLYRLCVRSGRAAACVSCSRGAEGLHCYIHEGVGHLAG